MSSYCLQRSRLSLANQEPALKIYAQATMQLYPALNSPLRLEELCVQKQSDNRLRNNCSIGILHYRQTRPSPNNLKLKHLKPALKPSSILLPYLLYLSSSLHFFTTSPPLSLLTSLSIYPHRWRGPSVARGGPLDITRARFCLHLACREMV